MLKNKTVIGTSGLISAVLGGVCIDVGLVTTGTMLIVCGFILIWIACAPWEPEA